MWPFAAEGLVVAWTGTGVPTPGFRVDAGIFRELSHVGSNREDDDRLEARGGRSGFEGAGADLLKACQASNELSIEVMVQCDNDHQSGPARILGYSRDGNLRNFSLCQEGGEYRLRLRTSGSDLNGMSPEVTLGPVDPDNEQHIMISYRPGELRCFIDGEEQDVKSPSGDFSNWAGEQMALVLGNEHLSERPWRGTVRKVAVYSRCFAEKELVWRPKMAMQSGWKAKAILKGRDRDDDRNKKTKGDKKDR